MGNEMKWHCDQGVSDELCQHLSPLVCLTNPIQTLSKTGVEKLLIWQPNVACKQEVGMGSSFWTDEGDMWIHYMGWDGEVVALLII